jgi:uracil phosphoribosyltransferase
MRDEGTPTHRFREAVRKAAVLLFYEAARDLGTETVKVTTPLIETQGKRVSEKIGLVPILRAGLGMADGILQALPKAEVWHLGLYRDEKTLEAISYYNKLHGAEPVDVAFVLDPMIATGGTATQTIETLKNWGVKRIKLVGILASQKGLDVIEEQYPDTQVYVCAVDPILNEHGYIVPGLGDAGDRQFGTYWGKDIL